MRNDVATKSVSSTLNSITRPLEEVVFGLRWQQGGADQTEIGRKVDLDASCILLNEHFDIVEIVHPGYARNANTSVVHTGDCKSGGGGWDDERIYVFLPALPEDVSTILFLVTSISGNPFERIANAYCHVTDNVTDQLLVELDLNRLGSRNAEVVARLVQVHGHWQLETGQHAGRENSGQQAVAHENVSLSVKPIGARHAVS